MNSVRTERRSADRYPTSLEGRIANTQTQTLIECTVWDLSETGVRLIVSDSSTLPLEFELQLPEQGAAAKVRLIWTTGIHYGAKFVD